MYPQQFHVFSEFVGGGFGGKQELLTEDLCVLAALQTGRPVKWEFTRSEQFTASTSRHPMKITIKLGAKKDGTLTAMQIHTVSDTGAYGNHGGEVLASSLGSSMATYRCPNKKGTGYAVYTNTVPSGAFRGYGASQPAFAIESAIDELGRKLGIDPFTMRRKNMIRAHDPVHSIWPFPHDGVIGSYGLDQCLDLVEKALASGRGEPKPDGDEWLEGKRCRHPCPGLCPPHGAPLGIPPVAAARRNLSPGGGLGGIRQRHPERAAAGRRHRAQLAGRGHLQWILSTPTKRPTTRAPSPARASAWRRSASRGPPKPCAKTFSTWPVRFPACPSNNAASRTGMCAAGIDRSRCKSSTTSAPLPDKLHVSRKVYGSPRSTAFMAHGFRIAVHRVTGEIRILQSVQAFDAGKIINPMQAQGQLEGGIAQGIGTTLFERMVIDASGAVVNPTFRNYRIPAFADIPRSEVFFVETHDRYGPLGAKPFGEAPIIPVAPAMGNALADATGIRFHSLPFSADRIFSRLAELQ